MKKLIKIKKRVYIHEEIRVGIFRFSFYRLNNKFCVRCEIASGWEN